MNLVPPHRAFSIALALAGFFCALAGAGMVMMLLDGLGEGDTVTIGIFIWITCLEFAAAVLIGVALAGKLARGAFPLFWTDAAVSMLACAFLPAALVLLWWFLGVRKREIAATESARQSASSSTFQ